MRLSNKILLLIMFVLCMGILAACSSPEYLIVWQNDDGTVLEQVLCQEGTVPLYSGESPVKPENAQFSYDFIGWDKEIVPADQNAVYVAQYQSTVKSYNVVWKDTEGKVFATETLPYGAMPSLGQTIATTADHQYQQRVSEWTPVPTAVTGDAEYTATSFMPHMYFPNVKITVNEEITKEYSDCQITTETSDDRYVIQDATAQIKVRGNGTSYYSKKPYRIKFAEKQTMFGLNDDLCAKSWVLLAEYTDRTMLKNATAFYLAQEIMGSDGYYVSDYMFVNVYINGEYGGLYLLAEQQQVNEGRITVDKASKKNPTVNTGYFIELDSWAATEDVTFSINYHDLKFKDSDETTSRLQTIYTVKSDIYNDDQLNFIKRKVQNTWYVLYDAAYTDRSLDDTPYYTVDANGDLVQDPAIQSAYEAVDRVIDVRSLVDTFILQEICENIDIGWSSFFISVDCSSKGNSKLTFEAPWDFDWALGQKGYIPDDYYTVTHNYNSGDLFNPWLLVVCNENWLYTLAAERWSELNTNRSIIQDAITQIDLYYAYGKEAFDQNIALWHDMMDYTEPTHTSDEYAAATSQAEAITWLKTFLSYRESFLNSVLGS